MKYIDEMFPFLRKKEEEEKKSWLESQVHFSNNSITHPVTCLEF